MASFLSDEGRAKFLPIQSESHYKVILRPTVEFDKVSRTTVFPNRGISYVFGSKTGVGGSHAEIIEVWFDRSKWTASSVMTWMQDHSDGLPTPGRTEKPPSGRPALAQGA